MEQLPQSITSLSENMSTSIIDSNIKCVKFSNVINIKGCCD